MISRWCLLGLILSVPALAADFVFQSQRNPGRAFTISDGKGDSPLTKDIDLGEDWDGLLEIRNLAADTIEVEMRYQTSMALSDEGPHLDLTDWLHHDSDWTKLSEKEKGHFDIPNLGDQAISAFPFVSKEALIKKVKSLDAVRAKRWLPIAKQCPGPSIPPCSVNISKVFFRVYKLQKPDRDLVREITLLLPLGC